DQDSWCVSWKYRSAKSTECVSTSPNTRSRRPSSRPLGRRISSRARCSGSATGASVIRGTLSEGAVQQRRETLAHAHLTLQLHLRHGAAATARHALQDPRSEERRVGK